MKNDAIYLRPAIVTAAVLARLHYKQYQHQKESFNARRCCVFESDSLLHSHCLPYNRSEVTLPPRHHIGQLILEKHDHILSPPYFPMSTQLSSAMAPNPSSKAD